MTKIFTVQDRQIAFDFVLSIAKECGKVVSLVQVGSGAIWFKQNVHFVSLDSEDMVVLPGYSVKIIKK